MSPRGALLFLVLLEFLIYVDRGIIPGSVKEVSFFLSHIADPKRTGLYIGLLQGSFIWGLSIGCPLFAYLEHNHSVSVLMSSGIVLWAVGACLVSFTAYLKTYWLLIGGRMLSGFGEASLVALAQPLILSFSKGGSTGIWMGVFCAFIPIGVSLGFLYGSLMSTTALGWHGAFLVEALIGVPFILFLGFCKPVDPEKQLTRINRVEPIDSIANAEDVEQLCRPVDKKSNSNDDIRIVLSEPKVDNEQIELDDLQPTSTSKLEKNKTKKNATILSNKSTGVSQESYPDTDEPKNSFLRDVKIVCSSPVFFWVTLGYSAYVAVLAVFTTFGTAFLLDLHFTTSETYASLVLGSATAIAGIAGGLCGGLVTSVATALGEEKESVENASDGTVQKSPEQISEQMVGKKLGIKPVDVKQLKMVFRNLIPILVVSMIILILGAAFSTSLFVFIALLGVGMGGLFATQSSINIGTMLGVPEAQRSFSLGLSTFFIHLFGDVPSPSIAGLLKDYLSPKCDPTDPDYASCVLRSIRGTRITIIVSLSWLLCMIVSIIFARVTLTKKIKSTDKPNEPIQSSERMEPVTKLSYQLN